MRYIVLALLLLASTAATWAISLPKTPANEKSAVELTGNETPAQLVVAYNNAIKSLLPGLAHADDKAVVTLDVTVFTAGRPGAEPERLACCNAIIAVLNAADTAPRVKSHLLHRLQLIGKAESVPVLLKLLVDADPHIASDARSALINNPACPEENRKQFAAEALASDQQDPAIAGDRTLQHADQLLRAGKGTEAAAIFAELSKPSQARQVRFAAWRGTLTVAGDAAVPKMIELLAGGDADGRTVALSQIKELSPQARLTLIAGCDKLPVTVQAIMIESLAGLDEKAILPLVLNSLKSSDPALQNAGLIALARLSGSETEAAVIAAMNESTGEMKPNLIGVLAKRSDHTAVPALLAVVDGADATSGKVACRALAELVTEDDASDLLKRLAVEKLNLRTDIETVAAKALARVEPSDRRVVLVETQFAAATFRDERCSALKMYRVCSGPKALAVVKKAMVDQDAVVREAAVRALADWPDDSAWESLLAVYQQPEKLSLGVLAWRGLVRLAQGANTQPNTTLIDRYRQLLTIAHNDADRRLVLGALGGCNDIAALDIAVNQLTATNLYAEAEMAVKNIAELVRKKHAKEADAALRQLKP